MGSFISGSTIATIGLTRLKKTGWKPSYGEVEARAANAPLSLENPAEVIYVEQGVVDVFSVPPPVDGKPSGARRYLWTVEKGETLFGFDPPVGGRGHTLVAVCAPGSRIRRMPTAQVEDEARKNQALFIHIVEGFVARLAGAMVLRPELDAVIQRMQPLELGEGKTAGTLGEMVWVQHMAGQTTFGGLPEVTLGPGDPPIPLAKGMWLQSLSADTKLFAADTELCLLSGDAFAGLARIRAIFRTCLARIAELEEDSEEGRLARKGEAEERMRSHGLSALASPLAGPQLDAAVGEDDDLLVKACRIIGAADGIVFKAPPNWEAQGRVRDPLAAICRASRVRSRRVTLRGEWWKHDAGNLLAFIEKSEVPVALLYTGEGYDLVDPTDMTRRPVTPKGAAALNWEAYVFYRPLPDAKIDGRGLLGRLVAESKKDLNFILVMALCAGLLTLLIPIATEHTMGKIVPGAMKNQVFTMFLALLGVHVGIVIFNLARAFTLVRLEGHTNASLQGAVVDRMLSLPVPFFRDNPVGELAVRALSINAARAVLTGAASVSLLAGVFSLLYLVLLLYYNWRLAILALLLIVITLLFVRHFAKGAVDRQRRNLEVKGKVSALVFQMIMGIPKLRVAAAENRLFTKWAEKFKEESELGHEARRYENAIKTYNELLPTLSSLALFWLAGYLVRNGHTIDTATFVAFNAAYGSLFASLNQFSDTVVSVLGVAPIIERAKPILETVPEVEQNKPDPGPLSGRIELSHLTFSYKKDGPLILDDVSMYALPGEYIAVVGPSGSGKSTTLRMMLGFENPDTGAVYYDGQDLRAVDLSGVRSQMGVVLQNSRLIQGSVFDNIVGSAPLTMEDAWAAAEMAGLLDDIKDMPMGMHTVVAEGGANLSGGQQQRLLIARALVRRPRILFFDEATSALDNRVQAQVSAALERLNATRFVIAHRLSTIQHADRIYVMEKGKVTQVGTFEELGKQPGLFADLMARQTL
jgi:NHLM bacteriocin system ABC transporter ATP-binding protein